MLQSNSRAIAAPLFDRWLRRAAGSPSRRRWHRSRATSSGHWHLPSAIDFAMNAIAAVLASVVLRPLSLARGLSGA
jgi:hypothetical protein